MINIYYIYFLGKVFGDPQGGGVASSGFEQPLDIRFALLHPKTDVKILFYASIAAETLRRIGGEGKERC